MPIYVWKCTACEGEVAVIRKVNDIETMPGKGDDIFEQCNHGEEHKWERIPTKSSFQLLGKGWFNNGGY